MEFPRSKRVAQRWAVIHLMEVTPHTGQNLLMGENPLMEESPPMEVIRRMEAGRRTEVVLLTAVALHTAVIPRTEATAEAGRQATTLGTRNIILDLAPQVPARLLLRWRSPVLRAALDIVRGLLLRAVRRLCWRRGSRVRCMGFPSLCRTAAKARTEMNAALRLRSELWKRKRRC